MKRIVVRLSRQVKRRFRRVVTHLVRGNQRRRNVRPAAHQRRRAA